MGFGSDGRCPNTLNGCRLRGPEANETQRQSPGTTGTRPSFTAMRAGMVKVGAQHTARLGLTVPSTARPLHGPVRQLGERLTDRRAQRVSPAAFKAAAIIAPGSMRLLPAGVGAARPAA